MVPINTMAKGQNYVSRVTFYMHIGLQINYCNYWSKGNLLYVGFQKNYICVCEVIAIWIRRVE